MYNDNAITVDERVPGKTISGANQIVYVIYSNNYNNRFFTFEFFFLIKNTYGLREYVVRLLFDLRENVYRAHVTSDGGFFFYFYILYRFVLKCQRSEISEREVSTALNAQWPRVIFFPNGRPRARVV